MPGPVNPPPAPSSPSGSAGGDLGGTYPAPIVEQASNGLVLPKTSGIGLQVELAAPTYPWHDLNGPLHLVATSGGTRPQLDTFLNNWQALRFTAGDLASIMFHLPHDYLPGSDVFLHIHWGHNGTSISGNLVVDWYTTYAKGHNQETFAAEVNFTQTISTPDITTIPQYGHRLNEFQLSSATPGAGQLDSADLEPDGIIGASLVTTTIPSISGGSASEPFIFFVDLHYQSTGMGTKAKAPNFYV